MAKEWDGLEWGRKGGGHPRLMMQLRRHEWVTILLSFPVIQIIGNTNTNALLTNCQTPESTDGCDVKNHMH